VTADPPAEIRVLIADDQAVVRAGLAMLLDSQPGLTVVGQAGNGQEAVLLARELTPDVVLMDIRMPLLDGLAATRHILRNAERNPPPRPVRVVVLTTSTSTSMTRSGPAPAASCSSTPRPRNSFSASERRPTAAPSSPPR